MKNHQGYWRLLLPALTCALGLVTSAGAQDRFSSSEPYSAPRTEYGYPDLQGNWNNSTLTPLARREGHDRVLRPDQVADLQAQREEEFAQGLEPSSAERAAPPVGGDGSTGACGGVGCYNNVYIDPGDQVARVNGEYRSSLVTHPSNGRIPELTPEGRHAFEALRRERSRFGEYDNPENRPLGERCIVSFGSNAGPPMLPNGWYNNNYTIVQTADHVVIMSEMVHDVRIIPIDQPSTLPGHLRPWFGDSQGRWKGDTLVVETKNLHPMQQYRGLPSDQLTVRETFYRADHETIVYGFTINDPAYSEPWGGEVPMVRMDDLLYEYACHEGNYALSNILSGARAQENGQSNEQR